MGMLQVGAEAPALALKDVDGKTYALDTDPAALKLALFFRTTCPTCQYAWKYYERLHEAYENSGLRVLGISQHDAQRTRDFRNEYHATFPHLLDEDFSVSRAYDPEFVPTGFLIDAQGKIIETIVSWQRERVNELSTNIAERLGVAAQTIVRDEDNAVAFKAG